MTLKEYCIQNGGYELFKALSENMDNKMLNAIVSSSELKKITLDVNLKFASISYDIIYDFMKFCVKNHVDAPDVKTF